VSVEVRGGSRDSRGSCNRRHANSTLRQQESSSPFYGESGAYQHMVLVPAKMSVVVSDANPPSRQFKFAAAREQQSILR
jgi:hypothetical protein